jgi:prepilin-type N-terminal cleavage/methylation domain-containing protein/prepilin-type processing-associated H-X9-DG protein
MKQRKGFTLVELLVVVGIIVILIAILLPALSKARAQAQNAQCQSNLHQVFSALLNYSLDNGGFTPSPYQIFMDSQNSLTGANGMGTAPANYGFGFGSDQVNCLQTYLGVPPNMGLTTSSNPNRETFTQTVFVRSQALCCPTAVQYDQTGTSSSGTFSTFCVYWDYVTDWGSDVPGASNAYSTSYVHQPNAYQPINLNRISHGSQAALLFDASPPGKTGSPPNYFSQVYFGGNGVNYAACFHYASFRTTTGQWNGYENVAFCDGHVDAISNYDFQNNPNYEYQLLSASSSRPASLHAATPDDVFWHAWRVP